MSYIHHSMERKFLKTSSAFKVIMVTGARQVGKSAMLKHLAQDTEGFRRLLRACDKDNQHHLRIHCTKEAGGCSFSDE